MPALGGAVPDNHVRDTCADMTQDHVKETEFLEQPEATALLQGLLVYMLTIII